VRRGAFRKILEIVVANNQPGVFCTHSGARHPGVTIGVGEINISIDKNVLIIRAASGENERGKNYDLNKGEGKKPKSLHKIDNRKSAIENRK